MRILLHFVENSSLQNSSSLLLPATIIERQSTSIYVWRSKIFINKSYHRILLLELCTSSFFYQSFKKRKKRKTWISNSSKEFSPILVSQHYVYCSIWSFFLFRKDGNVCTSRLNKIPFSKWIQNLFSEQFSDITLICFYLSYKSITEKTHKMHLCSERNDTDLLIFLVYLMFAIGKTSFTIQLSIR